MDCCWHGIICFNLSSINEGLPCAVVESLACGTPVLATPVGGIPEIITPDCGFLCDGTTSDALSEIIKRSRNLKYSRDRIVACAKKHTWKAVAAEINEVYEEVVSERR